ncbi:unnamed protein product [Choristocarpus tenellus]
MMQSHRVDPTTIASDLYRDVIVRNIFCTAGIVMTVTACTIATLVYEERSQFQAHTGEVLFLVDSVKNLLILSLTEVTHRSGFRGCISSMMRSKNGGNGSFKNRSTRAESDDCELVTPI